MWLRALLCLCAACRVESSRCASRTHVRGEGSVSSVSNVWIVSYEPSNVRHLIHAVARPVYRRPAFSVATTRFFLPALCSLCHARLVSVAEWHVCAPVSPVKVTWDERVEDSVLTPSLTPSPHVHNRPQPPTTARASFTVFCCSSRRPCRSAISVSCVHGVLPGPPTCVQGRLQNPSYRVA